MRFRVISSLLFLIAGVLVASISLFLPWFRGHLTVVGKTVNATAFPEILAIVLLGGALAVGSFIFFTIRKKIQLARFVTLAILLATIIGSLVILRSYADRSSLPGVGVQAKFGVILTFVGLVMALVGALAIDHKTPSGDDGE